MAHKHHILPKYKGGSDNSDNLVEVGVTQHAMFHYCNWQLWGDKRDWLAWKGLKGEVSKEEIVRHSRVLGGLKGGSIRASCPRNKERMSKLAKLSQKKATLAATSPEAKAKQKQSLARIKHQQGEKNSQHGTMWVTNGEFNKKIRKDDPLPEGYYPGRKLK